ncbi:hypothetical protein GGE68_002943 [Rhizobium leguminosarum]|nr:hypothetical protein [Rhizobium leguminosarum]
MAIFEPGRDYSLAAAQIDVFRSVLKLLDPPGDSVAVSVILLVPYSKGDAFF